MPFREKNKSYHWLSVCLHWLSALFVFTLFALGLWMVELSLYHPWYYDSQFYHQSLGMTLLLVILLRKFWLFYKKPAPILLENNIRRLATLGHYFIYLLILSIIVSGYLVTTADGRTFDFWYFAQVPAFDFNLKTNVDDMGAAHLYLSWLLIAVVLGHIAFALYHHFIKKDKTLKRMLYRA